MAVTFGIGWPWALARVRRYMVQNTRFGGVNARYTALGETWCTLLVLAGALIGGGLVGRDIELSGGSFSVTLAAVGTYLVSGLGFCTASPHRQGQLGHSSLGPVSFTRISRVISSGSTSAMPWHRGLVLRSHGPRCACTATASRS